MGNKEVTLLVLLDLSVAFDTMKHSIFLNILQQDFGVVGTALNWIASFLSAKEVDIPATSFPGFSPTRPYGAKERETLVGSGHVASEQYLQY